MSENLGTTRTAIQYQSKALQKFKKLSFVDDVTNKDFQNKDEKNSKLKKSIRRKAQEFVVNTIIGGGWKSTSGTGAISYTKVKEVVSRLVISNYLEIADEIDSVADFASQVANVDSEVIADAANDLKKELGTAVLAMYADAAAGQHYGVSYTTGTVAIVATTGAVTGSGATFTSSMVGKPFKADGHSKWYRVKSYASATSIVIENDSDDETSAYDGGTISAGATYEVQAHTAVALTKSTIKAKLDEMGAALTEADVPEDGRRWLALPVLYAKPVLLAAPEFNVDIEKVHGDVVQKGLVLKSSGFNLYFPPSSWFVGDNTNGLHCPGGHKKFITMGYGYIENISTIKAKDNPNGHSDLVKGLFGHGEKVADERRKAGVHLFATFSV